MPITLDWFAICVRLGLTIVAGVLIGMNRGEAGKVVGLRTTLLVSLAACLSMLQVNALLAQSGREPGSFAVLDLMRLPLGILSGVGFIGAGAKLRKDGLVKGMTAAATMWFVTVIGLCFGGGQLGLGTTGTLLGIVILWFFKAIEDRIPRENQAQFSVRYESGRFFRQTLIDALRAHGCRLTVSAVAMNQSGDGVEEHFDVRWHGAPDSGQAAAVLALGAQRGRHGI